MKSLQVFYGKSTERSAHVYAQVDRSEGGEGVFQLTGQVRGPRAATARTLPLTAELIDQGQGPSVLARALIPDPSYWSPDLPAVYDLDVRLERDGNVVSRANHTLGLRRFGVKGDSFYFSPRRWVLRGITVDSAEEADMEFLREVNASLVAWFPDESLCQMASDHGVVVAAILSGRETEVCAALERCSRWPAVALAILDADESERGAFQRLAPNIELGKLIRDDQRIELPRWATFAAVSSEDVEFFGRVAAAVPSALVAIGRSESDWAWRDRRSSCDRLQRNLAGIGDFAGYIV